jgi:methionyl-tRNA formyltransferase
MRKIRIAILTQDEPVYLTDNLIYLINNLPKNAIVSSVYFFETSPFGKKLNFSQKVLTALKTFGIRFMAKHTVRRVIARIFGANISRFLEKNDIIKRKLTGNINSNENLEFFRSQSYDLMISISGNQIFKSELLSIPKMGILNLHSSLLPMYRGLMPTFWALKNQDEYTGVSVFIVDEGIDTGSIVIQKRIPISSRSQHALAKETKRVGMDAIIEAVEKVSDNAAIDYVKNFSAIDDYYGFPTRSDVRVFYKKGNKF